MEMGLEMGLEEFRKKISEKIMLDEETISILYTALKQDVKAIMLRGPPGTGKTLLTVLIAELLGAEYVFYQCTTGTTEDDLLFKFVPSEETKSGIKIIYGPLPEALIKSQKKPVVLCLDEFDKTRPSADAMLLDFLQNCRVSVRIENEKNITGNKNNLIVFLTSNDEREFSEPLLRRVVSLKLSYLSPRDVYCILKNEFDEKITVLLTQIYSDTILAGLRKPATVQELKQLGNAIKILGDNADFAMLLRSYIIKYDDDWETFLQYIQSREPYQFANELNNFDNTSSNIVISAYESKEIEKKIEKEIEKKIEKRMPVKIPKLSWQRDVTFEQQTVETETEVEEVITEGCIIPSDVDHYDAAIKLFLPEPNESPAFLTGLGEFKKDYAILRCLTFEDLKTMVDQSVTSEKFLKDATVMIKFQLQAVDYIELIKLVKNQATIKYYSKDLIRFTYNDEVDIAVIPRQDTVDIEIVAKNSNIKTIKKIVNSVLAAQKNFVILKKSIKEFKKKAKEIDELIRKVSKDPHSTYCYYIPENIPPQYHEQIKQMVKQAFDKLKEASLLPYKTLEEDRISINNIDIPNSIKRWMREAREVQTDIEIRWIEED